VQYSTGVPLAANRETLITLPEGRADNEGLGSTVSDVAR
jgi:hypothetical protein